MGHLGIILQAVNYSSSRGHIKINFLALNLSDSSVMNFNSWFKCSPCRESFQNLQLVSKIGEYLFLVNHGDKSVVENVIEKGMVFMKSKKPRKRKSRDHEIKVETGLSDDGKSDSFGRSTDKFH